MQGLDLYLVFSILAAWLACSAVWIGMGVLILRRFYQDNSLTHAFWIGLGTTVAILEVYHFFSKIDLRITLLICAIGVFGILSSRASLQRQLACIWQTERFAVVCGLAVSVLIAFRASRICMDYDTGLYGLGAVRWFITYPIVPGLANLHGRLGFNSSAFLCVAALDQGILRGVYDRIFTGLLVVALFSSIIPSWVRMFRPSSTPAAADWFVSILLIPASCWLETREFVGTMTDLPATVCCLVAAAILFRTLEDRNRGSGDSGPVKLRLFVAMTLFALAIVFKLSVVVFASVGWLIALVKLWSCASVGPERKRPLGASVLLSALIILPWIARGFVLSGYPFYPNTSFGLRVDWRVPVASANADAGIVRSWARLTSVSPEDNQGFAWFRPWFHDFWTDRLAFLSPTLLTVSGGLAVCLALATRKLSRVPGELWLLVPCSIGLAFWILEAPSFRFGEAVIWTTAATLGALGIQSINPSLTGRKTAILGLHLTSLWTMQGRGLWAIWLIGTPLMTGPGSPSFLGAPAVARQTVSGLTVNIPLEGPECWDAPLPCTPYFNRKLALRRKDNIRWGFFIDGAHPN
jgi:hypothetical protein